MGTPGEYVGVKNSNPYIPLDINENENVDGSGRKKKKYRVDVVGSYVRPDIFPSESWDHEPQRLDKNEFFVTGDNGFRSVDSRVWGNLNRKYIFGTAKLVVWPLQDFGPIPKGNIY